MLTLAAVERSLYASLCDPKLTIRLKHIPDSGRLEAGHQTITINPFEGGLTEIVVHELIHKAYHAQLGWWGQLEEPLAEAAEDTVVRYINRNDKRRLKWHRTIQSKLPDQ